MLAQAARRQEHNLLAHRLQVYESMGAGDLADVLVHYLTCGSTLQVDVGNHVEVCPRLAKNANNQLAWQRLTAAYLGQIDG